MSSPRDLSSIRQLDTSTPGKTAADLGRLVGNVDEILRSLPRFFRERLRPNRSVTHVTARPLLKLGACEVVDTTSGAISLYLPRATPGDNGRASAFVKTASSSLPVLPSRKTCVM